MISPSADLHIRLTQRRVHLFQSYQKVPTKKEDGVWSRIRSPSSSRQIRKQTTQAIFKLFSSKYNGKLAFTLEISAQTILYGRSTPSLCNNPVFRLPILLGFYCLVFSLERCAML